LLRTLVSFDRDGLAGDRVTATASIGNYFVRRAIRRRCCSGFLISNCLIASVIAAFSSGASM